MVTLKQTFSFLPDQSPDPDAWVEAVRLQGHLPDVTRIHHAVQLADEACKGLTTFYGQPCIAQSLQMAEILLEMKLDQDAIAAAIITNALQHNTLTLEKIAEELGEPVRKLASNVLKINVLNNLQNKNIRNQIQVDRLRKIFLAMVSDIRVVLIKLAERTCLMRNIKNINETERKRIATETMDIYAPLANRLGIGQLKWELEDTAFHYIDPDTYKTIATFLAERRLDRENKIEETIQKINTALLPLQIKAEIKGRAKHIYSIYLKATRKDVEYNAIHDYSALRILVDKIEECYTALSVVHTLFQPIAREFDDYISHPKPNGYRSIHTAVVGLDEKPLEIQIRTKAMHEEAEHGVAAHWVYKEHKTPESGYEAKITFLRQLLAWHKEMAHQDASEDTRPDTLTEDTVYVLTPQGEIIDLPTGATPLDFAYHIHSEIGHRCRGAKIRGHIVPLTYHLQTGDQVEIITTLHGTPSRDWLNRDSGYLHTSRARSKVAHWFKHQEMQSHSAETGKNAPERETFRPKISYPAIEKIAEPSFNFLSSKPFAESEAALEIAGMSDLLTRLARCCKPIPGDSVTGYITQGRGVSIHRKDCRNMMLNHERNSHRMIPVAWDTKKPANFLVDLAIQAYGQQELLKEITALLANAKIDLVALNSNINRKNNMIYIVLTVQIQDVTQLTQIIHQIGQLPKVMDVRRTGR